MHQCIVEITVHRKALGREHQETVHSHTRRRHVYTCTHIIFHPTNTRYYLDATDCCIVARTFAVSYIPIFIILYKGIYIDCFFCRLPAFSFFLHVCFYAYRVWPRVRRCILNRTRAKKKAVVVVFWQFVHVTYNTRERANAHAHAPACARTHTTC